jgi:hypothetical protein
MLFKLCLITEMLKFSCEFGVSGDAGRNALHCKHWFSSNYCRSSSQVGLVLRNSLFTFFW